MKRQELRRLGCGLSLLVGLTACGGGGGNAAAPTSTPHAPPTTQPSAPVDSRLTLVQYQATRPEPMAAARPEASSTSSAQAVAPFAEPLALRSNLLHVPALREGLRSLLLASARGPTLSQVQTLLPELGAWTAPLLARSLYAPSEALFNPQFLQASDVNSALAAPLSWQAEAFGNANTFQPAWPDGLDPSRLEMEAGAKLVVIDRVSQRLRWPQGSRLRDGLIEHESGMRSVAPMREVEGLVWQHRGGDWEAEGLSSADGYLLRISPQSGTLGEFAQQGMAAALAQLQALLRTDQLKGAQGHLRLPEGPLPAPDLAAPLPHALQLPFDKLNGDLGALDGVPSYARLALGSFALDVNAEGLRLQGGMALALGPRPNASASYGSVVTWIPVDPLWPPPCPDLGPALRSHLLVWLDSRHRVVALAAVLHPSGQGKRCN